MSYKHPTATELGIECTANARSCAEYAFKTEYNRWPTLDDKEYLIQYILKQQKEDKEFQIRLLASIKKSRHHYVDYSDQAFNNIADDF